MADGHVFIDESVRRGYFMSAALIAPRDLAIARRRMRGLLLPGQRSLHMKDERDSRRREILSAIEEVPATLALFERGLAAGHAAARSACLRAAMEWSIGLGTARVVLDRSDSTVRTDRRTIAQALREHGGARGAVEYDHLARHEEPLLWIPDAVAWSWGRTGEFHARAASRLTVRRL